MSEMSVEASISELLTRAGAQDHPRRDDVLYRIADVAGSESVVEAGEVRPATNAEVAHARALTEAFALKLSPELERPQWLLSDYASAMYPGFALPASLAAVDSSTVAVWKLYAESALPPFVVSHLADLVASRRVGLLATAELAINARLEILGQIDDISAAWHLGRALGLALQFGQTALQTAAEDALLDLAKSQLRGDFALGTFLRSLEPLALRKLRIPEVTDLLDRGVEACGGGSFALVPIHDLQRQIAQDEAGRVAADRRGVQSLLDEASVDPDGIRTLFLLQSAYEAAVERGLVDMADEALARMREIPRESYNMEGVAFDSPLPEKHVASQVALVVGQDSLLSALTRIARHCPTGDVQELRTRVQAGEGTATISAIFPTIVMNAEQLTKIKHAGDDTNAALAFLQDIHLRLHLEIYGEALDDVQFRYDVGDERLTDQIADTSGLGNSIIAKLVRCLRRFWNEDYEGAAYVGTSLVEGLMRARLLATGVEPYNLPNLAGQSVGMYKTLGTLLEQASDSAIDESWIAFMKFALTDAAHGWNLRNELAHGGIDEKPGPVVAAIVLIAALYLVLGDFQRD